MLRRVLSGHAHSSVACALRLRLGYIFASRRLVHQSKTKTDDPIFESLYNDLFPSPGPSVPRRDNNIANKDTQRSIRALRTALSSGDAPTVQREWKSLSSGASGPLLPQSYDELSEGISSALANNRIPARLADCMSEVEDMAIQAAVEGFPHGLFDIMHTHLRCLDPQGVLRVYHRFMKSTTPPEKTTPGETTQSEDDDIPYTDVLLSQPTRRRPVADEISKQTRKLEDRLHSEMLMYAVAATAMHNDFRQAVHLVIAARCYFTGGDVRAFMNRLGSSFVMAEPVHRFLRRASTAALLCRPENLFSHTLQLSERHATVALRELYQDVVEGISHKDAWLTIDPQKVSSETPLAVSPSVWALLLTGFMRNGRLDWAEELWDTMTELGVTPNQDIWRALVSGYGHLKMPEQVIHSWDAMIKQGLSPDIKLYRSVITSLLVCKRETQALEHLATLQRLLDHGQIPAFVSQIRSVFNSALNTYLGILGQLQPALQLLKRMEAVGPSPDIHTIDHFLTYFSKRGEYKAFAEMLQKINAYGLIPSDYTYANILTAMLPVREDAVSVVFNFMRKFGKTPNVAMYTIVIDALMEERTMAAFQTALRLLQQMETSNNVQPTEVTYICILTGILRANWMDREVAEEYVDLISRRMKKRRMMLSVVSYHILIRACLENPAPEGVQTAMDYYREMQRRHITPITDTWYILLHGLAKRGEWGLADLVVEDLQKSGFTPGRALANLIARVRERRPYLPESKLPRTSRRRIT